MHRYTHGCTCIGRNLKGTVLWGTITWSEMEKQIKQVKRSIDHSECVLYFCYVINVVSVHLAWERGRSGAVGHVLC